MTHRVVVERRATRQTASRKNRKRRGREPHTKGTISAYRRIGVSEDRRIDVSAGLGGGVACTCTARYRYSPDRPRSRLLWTRETRRIANNVQRSRTRTTTRTRTIGEVPIRAKHILPLTEYIPFPELTRLSPGTLFILSARWPVSPNRRPRFSQKLLAHLSPLGWEHIGLTGDYTWRENKRVAQNWRCAFRP